MMLVVRLLASVGALGYLPISGAFGSLAGIVIIFCAGHFLPHFLLFLSLLGFYLCTPARKAFGSDDPKEFVLDEVCGMMLSVLWLPLSAWGLVAAYVLFRVFDVAKPWPISLCQKMKHSSSIMWDDLAAGLFTNLILRAVYFAVFPRLP